MKKLVFAFYFFVLAMSALAANTEPSAPEELFYRPVPGRVMVANRILAKVNGTAITALDVQRKLDVIFYKQFPQYASNPEARYQFYLNSWKFILGELVNKELILADAKTMKMEVSAGDVRQELEDTFGPDMLANLDKVGLTYEEAWTLTHDDILLRRMMMARVNSKAIMKVGPKHVCEAYGTLSEEKSEEGEWLYQVVTLAVDKQDTERTLRVAHQAADLLRDGRCRLDKLKSCLALEGAFEDSSSLSISSDLRRNHKDISEAHRALLTDLEEGGVGQPLLQTARNGGQVVRFALLKEKTKDSIPGFTEVSGRLRDTLIQTAISAETQDYFTFLRKRYSVEESSVTAADSPFVFIPRRIS